MHYLPTYLPKYMTVVTVVTEVTVVNSDKITQPLNKKITQPLIYIFLVSQYFGKEQIDTFDNPFDVLRAEFCNSRDV